MDVAINKQATRRVFEEGFGAGNLEVVDECVAPAAIDRHPFEAGEDFRSHLKGVITMLRSAMPDLQMTVEDLIGEGTRVAARVTLSGHHTGSPLFGVEASGRPVRVEQFHFIDYDEDARGLVHWANIGVPELMSQLRGAVPVPA
jgi:predicted ester cyclase